jgi:tetratricopeptide (TPR) repeat protein
MLGVSERQLKAWERQGLIPAADSFGFSDLIALRTLQKLRENRVPSSRIGEAITSLKKKLSDIEHPLSELKIVSNGRRVAVRIAGQQMEPVTGQLLFDFDAGAAGRVRSLPARTAPALSREREAEFWFERGLRLEEAGQDPHAALAAYKKALEFNPNAAGAMVNIGTIYYRMHDLIEAEKYYRRAVEADPRYPLARFNLGNLFDEQNDMAQAEHYYLSAVDLNPRYADAYFNLALVAEKKGETLRSVRYWKTYLKLDPSSSWAEIARKQLARLCEATVIRAGPNRDRQ